MVNRWVRPRLRWRSRIIWRNAKKTMPKGVGGWGWKRRIIMVSHAENWLISIFVWIAWQLSESDFFPLFYFRLIRFHLLSANTFDGLPATNQPRHTPSAVHRRKWRWMACGICIWFPSLLLQILPDKIHSIKIGGVVSLPKQETGISRIDGRTGGVNH